MHLIDLDNGTVMLPIYCTQYTFPLQTDVAYSTGKKPINYAQLSSIKQISKYIAIIQLWFMVSWIQTKMHYLLQ